MSKRKSLTSLSDIDAKEEVSRNLETVATQPQKKERPYNIAFYIPKSWHVELKKQAAVDDNVRVNDYVMEGLRLWFKSKGIAIPDEQ